MQDIALIRELLTHLTTEELDIISDIWTSERRGYILLLVDEKHRRYLID